MADIKVLGISGSLRVGSHNFNALQAARELLPSGMSLEICDPLDFPMYSEEAIRSGFPEIVTRFRARVAAADAFLFAAPEYNFAISAVLKNALEWASRPPTPPFAGKACAIFGATTSPAGTMRAQSNLRQICVSLDLHPVNVPQIDLPEAQKKFDAQGHLSDQPSREAIRSLLNSLYNLSMKFRPS